MDPLNKIVFSAVALWTGLSATFSVESAGNPPPCYEQLQTTFFRQDLLTTALGIYLIDQSVWTGIYNDLLIGSQHVPRLVQEIARSSNPNPLYPAFEPNGAARILQQALFTIFQSVMQKWTGANGNVLINQNSINGIFRYLWEQQFNNSLLPCLRAQV